MLLPFGTGTTDDLFQSPGTSPSCIDLINIIITPLMMAVAVALSITAEMSFGPFAKESSSSMISSSVHKSSGQQSEDVLDLASNSRSLSVSGGTHVFKHLEKKVFSASAF